MIRHLRLLLGSALLVLLGGCATVSNFRGIPATGRSLHISGVPPILQDETLSCGHASLAAVAGYWGVGQEHFRTKLGGGLPQEASGAQLQAEAEALGLQAFVYRGSPDDLEANLRAGRPIIVLIPLPADPQGFPGGPLGVVTRGISALLPHPAHWVVLVGRDQAGNYILHDPRLGPLLMERHHFLAGWARMDNCSLLLVAHPT